MTVQPQIFKPDMISPERRPFYDSFVKKTGEIAAKFISTEPKPHGVSAGSLLDSINRVDLQVGSNLLMWDPESLFAQILSLPKGNGSLTDFIINDPITRGLIENERPVTQTDGGILYKSVFKDIFVFVADVKTGSSDENFITSSLVGSKTLETGKLAQT